MAGRSHLHPLVDSWDQMNFDVGLDYHCGAVVVLEVLGR